MTVLDTINPKRICLIKPSAFGDVAQTLPLLPVLKERFPRADVSWVIRSELQDLLTGHPHLDEIIPFQRKGSWRNWGAMLRGLRARKFDLVFDLQGLLRSAVMTWATRAPLRIGLETAREGAQWACHHTLPDTGRWTPAHLRYWRIAEALGCGEHRRETHITTSHADRRFVAELTPKGRPILAVHAGARWETKRWPVENFAVVAARASRQFGFSVLILGSREEAPVALQLQHHLRRCAPGANVLELAGGTTIKQLAALLKRVDVLLTNDSGPMHLAAGLGTPVLGIFTATNPLRSGPPGHQHELVTTALPCHSCYKKQCPKRGRKKRACLQDITTEEVWSAFTRLVDRHARPRRAA